ncbi:hypothetical protein K8B83_21230 [Shewanella inventionis]|uniref:hypothetical protein n=1 Tax=Shewanella TaxID=22 RepID=UPI001CBDF75C|nr:hypothetical protein [Shewanella inventionis]UAL43275.1 hypothetical protein K8B83_21230 [Shewanella inventionis]
MSALDNYYSALERLINNKPNVLKNGEYKITQNSVCLEAGVGIGAIKPSRGKHYQTLINEIKKSAKKYSPPMSRIQKLEQQLKNKKEKLIMSEALYHQVLNRELMLIQRVKELESRLSELIPEVVKPIR